MLVDRGSVLQRVSWTAIIAGLLAGLVTQIALSVLGLAIGLLNLSDGIGSLGGLAASAAIWVGLSLAVAAYVAGHTAARAAGYLTPAQGRFNGLLTGMLLLLASTVFAANLISTGINRVLGLASSAVNTAASVAGGAATAATGAADANGGLEGLLRSAGLGDAYQAVTSGLSEEELTGIIADASPELNQGQVTAASQVIRSIVNNASRDLGTVAAADVTDLPAFVGKRVDAIGKALKGPEFARRLQARGLSQAQAREVSTVVNKRFTELRTQGEQAAKTVADTASKTASDAASAAGKAAWGWLLAAGLVLGLSAFGGGRGADVPPGGLTTNLPTPSTGIRDGGDLIDSRTGQTVPDPATTKRS